MEEQKTRDKILNRDFGSENEKRRHKRKHQLLSHHRSCWKLRKHIVQGIRDREERLQKSRKQVEQ
jgi:hypothetical protein